MPYLGRAPAAIGTIANVIEGDLKVKGTISGESINDKFAFDTAADINDHFLIEAGGTDGSGTNAGDNMLLEDTTEGLAESVELSAITDRAGTSGQLLTSAGAGAPPTFTTVSGGGLQSVQTFTSSGTWNRPSGITKVMVYVVGGGGGGGGGTSSGRSGGGGGGGGCAIEFLDVSSTSSATVTIGAAGAAGASRSTGGTGGTTSFASLCSATGGVGGAGTANSVGKFGGAGGAGANGSINFTGGGGVSGAAGGSRTGGAGGSSFFGGGARGNAEEGGAGDAGLAFGGGGSGAETDNQIGGVGFAGVVFVEEYA